MASQEIIAYSQATTYRQLLFANCKLQFEQFHQQNSTFLTTHSWTLLGHGHPFHTPQNQTKGHIS